jgi:Uma2 family endonuclease
MDQIIEQVLHSPKVEIYARQIEEVLRNERILRQRFFDEVTEDEKAEFINGEKVVHSPVRLAHGDCVRRLSRLVSAFVDVSGIGVVGIEALMVSLSRNDYEPDLCFWRSEKSSAFSRDQKRFPAPDWIAEVLSPSTEANDRGVKFEDYAAHGVSEYWIIDPDKSEIEQYELRGAAYELTLKSYSGVIRSRAITGFEIPVSAVFDDSANLAAMRKLLA